MFVGTKDFPRSLQLDNYSCGARSVYSILNHFGRNQTYSWVKEKTQLTSDGCNVADLVAALRGGGLRVGYRGGYMSFKELVKIFKKGGVALIHVDGDHFIVAHGYDGKRVWVADPSFFRCPTASLPSRKFRRRWCNWGLAVFPPRSGATLRRAA